MLVGQRLAGLAAALADSIGELNHLIDRLLAVQLHDVVDHEPPKVVVGLAGLRGRASTNMGTMTSGHPWRIKEIVPSKSNRTWPISGRGARGTGSSTLGHSLWVFKSFISWARYCKRASGESLTYFTSG